MSDILMKGTEPIGQVSDLTADNVEYSSGVSVKDKLDDVDLTSGGTINGRVQISYAQESYLLLGDNSGNKGGMLRIYDKNDSYCVNLYALDSNQNRNIGIPTQNGIMGLQDKVTILASSTGSKTYAQHIATLKEVWDTLSTAQKMKCMIRRRDQYTYVPTDIVNGIFTMSLIDSQKVYIEMLKMSNSTFEYLSGTTYTDLSNNTVNQSFYLYLPL